MILRSMALAVAVGLFSLRVSSQEMTATQAEMLRDLDFISQSFGINYAPVGWKQEQFGWTLEQQIANAKSAVLSQSDISAQDFQIIVRDLFRSPKDYHVSVGFQRTEKSILPFSIKGAEGRYFIAYINRNKLAKESFPFEVGDEILEINNQPIQQVISTIINETGQGVELTDQALAEYFVTYRAASFGMTCPSGAVTVRLAKKSDEYKKSVEHQLIWDYSPEVITFPGISIMSSMESPSETSAIQKLKNKQMVSYLAKGLMAEDQDDDSGQEEKDDKDQNPHWIGARVSFIPALGPKIWESSKKDIFYAYVYRAPEGKVVGYVRIPYYGGGAKAVKEFADLIKKFEEITDALVIDQVNNPGGSVFYLYALARLLSPDVLRTPQHHMKLNTGEVFQAATIESDLREIKSDSEARKKLGEEFDGFPVSYQTVEFLRNFTRFVKQQWTEGKTLTDPYYIFGADQLNPHENAYSKPIVILVNSLDFSGGDFFPAILQDNKRAKIFGTRTAGAGGYVNDFSYPNRFGIERFSLTMSLAKRIDGRPLENFGVIPDVEYNLTVADLTGEYKGYIEAINKSVVDLLK